MSNLMPKFEEKRGLPGWSLQKCRKFPEVHDGKAHWGKTKIFYAIWCYHFNETKKSIKKNQEN